MVRTPAGANDEPRPWRRRQRDIAYVAWASFLMACAGTAVFFAMVDPLVLSGTTTPGWEISREAGYAIGFFGFWLLTAATGVFLVWLVRTENGPRRVDGVHPGRRQRDPLRRRGRRDAGRGREAKS